MGIVIRVRPLRRSSTIVDSGEDQASMDPEANDSAKTLIVARRINSDERAQSSRAPPINRRNSSSAINCSPVMKVSKRSWFAGIEKAIRVLDTLGSSMSDLSSTSDFSSGAAIKGDKISILAFEVAKTILKGSRLMQSFSDDYNRFFKTTVLLSKGVQTLISEDNDELVRIAAADKREEVESFLREVVRFGNRCKDSQWRNLDLYFEKLDRELTSGNWLNRESAKHLKAESAMQQLMTLVQETALLLSELCAMDEVEKVCSKYCQEENTSSIVSSTVQREDFANLVADIKNRRKHVKALKKKSLWSKSFEEVVEKLVDIAKLLLLQMNEAFGNADGYKSVEDLDSNKITLGPAGIALHYATIIIQIDTLGTLSGSSPSSMRESLYQRLPYSITSALPVKLGSFQIDLEFDQIKAEMDKTLHWLSPIARNTTKSLQGIAQSGGLANFRSEVSKEVSGRPNVLRIETLYHADKEKTEACILELLVWLHHLISKARNGSVASSSNPPNLRSQSSTLSIKDKEMIANVGDNRFTSGASKSQNFAASKTKISKINRLTKSSREYPISHQTRKDPLVRWPSCDPVIDFDIGWSKTLDVIDGLESI